MPVTDSADELTADICVIGAGSAGLSVAAGAAQMGARTVLIESARMGGDCLNTGCVPSKALIAAAAAAHDVRSVHAFGVRVSEPEVDFTRVHDHVRDVIAQIAPHDSEERFTKLGCTVIRARARFRDARTVQAGNFAIRARRFVIATGSRPAIPHIPGLDQVPYFTNETLFDNRDCPEHLIIIGAGPIGVEMAQAHRRLGAKVTVLDLGPMLPKDDPEAVALVRAALKAEQVDVLEHVTIGRIARDGDAIAVVLADGCGAREIKGSHLLVAAGRTPDLDELNLEAAGVRYTGKGIDVDRRLRTANHRIYALGDVVGSYQFTHVAAYHASIVLQNALFHLPAKVDLSALPWVTYTDPEVAQVGMTEAQARHAHRGAATVLKSSFSANDRARTARANDGFIKVVVGKRGRILGATIVGRSAGELVLPWVLAISNRLRTGAFARAIVPYPSLSEISKAAAGSYYTPALFSARTRWLVKLLGWFG